MNLCNKVVNKYYQYKSNYLFFYFGNMFRPTANHQIISENLGIKMCKAVKIFFFVIWGIL